MTDPVENTATTSAVVQPEAAEPEAEGNWDRVVIVTHGRIPEKVGRRKVIVVEQRSAPVFGKDGSLESGGEVKVSGYPKGADLYYRTDPSVQFPEDADVIGLGEHVAPKGVGGFATKGVRVGDGNPAYAAANLAYQRGARQIEIVGLSKAEQERQQVWFDSKMPDDLTVTFA